MTDPRGPSSSRPDRSLSPRAMAAVVVGVTLLAGILVGIGLDRAVLRPPRFGPAFGLFRDSPNANVRRQQMRAEFARQLHLTPDQAARIDTIMLHRMAAFDSIRHETSPRIRALVGATRAQIDSVLTPEQRDRFHSLQHRRSHRFPHDSGGRAPQ